MEANDIIDVGIVIVIVLREILKQAGPRGDGHGHGRGRTPRPQGDPRAQGVITLAGNGLGFIKGEVSANIIFVAANKIGIRRHY